MRKTFDPIAYDYWKELMITKKEEQLRNLR